MQSKDLLALTNSGFLKAPTPTDPSYHDNKRRRLVTVGGVPC